MNNTAMRANRGDCGPELHRLGLASVPMESNHRACVLPFGRPALICVSLSTPPQSLKENPVFLGEPGNGQTGLDTGGTVSPSSDAVRGLGALEIIMQTYAHLSGPTSRPRPSPNLSASS